MTHFLCISVRYLDPVPAFHGRRDGGEPEWPPSPLRLFQAMLDSAANRWRNAAFQNYAEPALVWLERLPSPTLVTPKHLVGKTYRLAVPNNDMDSPANVWARGQEPVKPHRPVDLRTMKPVCPTHLRGSNEDDNAVHYLYPLPEDHTEFERHRGTLQAAANSITHLGWGVDMAVGDAKAVAQEEADRLPGERWRPVPVGGTPLRVPIDGTLADLVMKHDRFLSRLSKDGFKPVPPLSAFRVVGYRRATDPARRPFAAFQILKPDASGYRSFDTTRRTRDVAAWVRAATAKVCEGWPFESIESFVYGHGGRNQPLKGENADQRFMFLPLPTINHALSRVESIRRVLIAAPPGCQDRIDWIRRRLPGQDLLWNDDPPIGLLNILPTSDWVLRQYTGEATTWSTVTPVILPGFDDPQHYRRRLKLGVDAKEQKRLLGLLDERIEGLLRKALVQAGIAPELAESAETKVEWGKVGFRAGLDLASRYYVPDNLKRFPAYHVRVSFPHRIPGPFAVGAGRYRGLGLFAAMGNG